MYNSSRAKEIKATNKVITAGINEDCKLLGAEMKVSPIKGNAFIEIAFENKEGVRFTQTEWTPTKFEGMSDADLEAKYDTQYARMLQILECFYPEEQLNFNGESFVEFADWLVNLLNNADKSSLLRIKLVYNNKGYITLPSYAKFKFIEKMNIEKSQIILLDKDQITKPELADKEVANPNPLNGTTNTNGLPF